MRLIDVLCCYIKSNKTTIRLIGVLLLLPLLLLTWLPSSAQAQDPTEVIDWRELQTENFTIVYAAAIYGPEESPVDCPLCGIDEAERYADFVDSLYTDLATIFEVELKTPINLRLFPTEHSYFVVNPLAEYLTGVIAHALNTREEIAVAVPRTQFLTDEELINNMRHEFTHLFASQLSAGNLKSGFQEGIAQYLEKPTDKAATDPALLEMAFEQGRLLSWDDLSQSRQIYADPQVAYPQSLSVVAFLIDRYGFPKFIDFIKATSTEPGYRTALSVTYSKSAEELEAEWLDYLPDYLAGRWQINAVYSYDLGRVTDLVNRGAYSDAKTEIADIVTLLETTEQYETLARADALLEQADKGQQAGLLADEARAALAAGDYALAIDKGQAAVAAYDTLGYRNRIPEIQLYIYRAELGQEALQQLDHGASLLDQFRFFEAERQIHEATIRLQALNNQPAAEDGITLLHRAADRQSQLAYFLFAIGGLLFVANGLHRLVHRLTANPLEVEFR